MDRQLKTLNFISLHRELDVDLFHAGEEQLIGIGSRSRVQRFGVQRFRGF
jgi:hypothetical protein